MIEGRPAAAPFAYRPLVPGVADVLPLQPVDALFVVNLACFAVALWLSMLVAERAGASRTAGIAGAAVAACSWASAFSFLDPYLTDTAGCAAVALMAYMLVTDRWGPFTLAGMVGVLAREPVAAYAFAWLGTRSRLVKTIVSFAACVGVIVAARLLIDADGEVSGTSPWGDRLSNAVKAWGPLWLALPALAAARHRERLIAGTAALVVAGVVASFMVADTWRMFFPLLPFVAVACAILYDRASNPVRIGLVTLAPLYALTLAPTRLTNPTDAGAWMVGLTLAGFVVVAHGARPVRVTARAA